MSDFGALNVAPSLRSSWVDENGKPIAEAVKVEELSAIQILSDRLKELEETMKCRDDIHIHKMFDIEIRLNDVEIEVKENAALIKKVRAKK